MILNSVINQRKNNILKIGLYILFFAGIYAVFALVISQLADFEDIKNEIGGFILQFGLFGLFLTVILLDAITQPISPDFAVFSAVYFGNLDIVTVIIIAGLGSTVAGIICYSIGKSLGIHFIKKYFHNKSIAKGEAIINKYGIVGVMIGAITPVPYDLLCYLSGIFKVNRQSFMLVALLGRFIRFSVVAGLTFALF